MSRNHSTIFDPPPDAADAAILALTDPSLSFNDLARAFNTTPEALALWMIRPDIRRRLESTDRVVTWRTRLIASTNLAAATAALAAILEDFNRATDRGSARSVPDSPATQSSTADLRTDLLNLRRAENARRAANSLIRLSNLRPNTFARVEAAAALQPTISRAHSDATPDHAAAHAGPEPSARSDPSAPAPSFESILVQLAPHLETIAAQLGIDPEAPSNVREPQPEPTSAPVSNAHPPATPGSPRQQQPGTTAQPLGCAATHAQARAPTPAPARRAESRARPALFQERSPALLAGTAHEHWP